MQVCNSPGIFQEKMNEILRGIEFIRFYINDLLEITKGDCSVHLDKLELVIKILEQTGLSTISKSHTLEKPRWNIWVSR